jgi:hypothetical protein
MTRKLALLTAVLSVAWISAAVGPASATPNRWPLASEHSFLRSCYLTSGGRIAGCRCELAWLERRFTYRGITALYLHDQTRLRPILAHAALSCP